MVPARRSHRLKKPCKPVDCASGKDVIGFRIDAPLAQRIDYLFGAISATNSR